MFQSGEFISTCGLALALLIPFGNAQAGRLSILYDFCSAANCADGQAPFAGLITDSAGNLYGTTEKGGNDSGECGSYGCGTVFKLAPDGTETVLHSFAGGSDGSGPLGGLIMDSEGNLYGTTAYGGDTACSSLGCGTVFKVAPDGTETVLHAFAGADGGYPAAGLIMDSAGNLYGTTQADGIGTGCYGYGCGTVFELTPDGTETTLYSFTGGLDGGYPAGGLIIDSAGNLYGATVLGGTGGCNSTYYGCGTVFKVAPDRTETVLYSFTGGSDGRLPSSDLISDQMGNLYGTAFYGGTGCDGNGCGTVFKVAPDGTETTLYSFTGGTDGNWPHGGLIMDQSGNLYGTTEYGGNLKCNHQVYQEPGCGTVFKLAPDGTKTVLQSFAGKIGKFPLSGLLKNGRYLLGTTQIGGSAHGGTVFKVKD